MLPVLSSRSLWPSHDLLDETNRMFDRVRRLWGNGGEEPELAAYPVDIREDDKTITVEAELPGFKRDEITVNLEDGVLSIQAERKSETERKDERRHLHERRFTRVERSFRLPATVNDGDVNAELKDGVLRIVLPKSPAATAHRIAIK